MTAVAEVNRAPRGRRAQQPKPEEQTPAPLAVVSEPATSAPEALPVEEKKRQVGMIVPNRVQMAEHGRNAWLATTPNADHPEDFLEPAYWGHVSKNFKPYDLVEVRTDDATFWGQYVVLASDRTWAKLHPIHEVRLPSMKVDDVDPRFRIEHKGPHLKYCVIRASDNSAVREGEQERGGALRWLEGYLRTIGKRAA